MLLFFLPLSSCNLAFDEGAVAKIMPQSRVNKASFLAKGLISGALRNKTYQEDCEKEERKKANLLASNLDSTFMDLTLNNIPKTLRS